MPRDSACAVGEEALEAFVADALESFHATAAAVGGATLRTLRIAGRAVQLHFAAPVLESRLTPALEHHSIRAGRPRP